MTFVLRFGQNVKGRGHRTIKCKKHISGDGVAGVRLCTSSEYTSSRQVNAIRLNKKKSLCVRNTEQNDNDAKIINIMKIFIRHNKFSFSLLVLY